MIVFTSANLNVSADIQYSQDGAKAGVKISCHIMNSSTDYYTARVDLTNFLNQANLSQASIQSVKFARNNMFPQDISQSPRQSDYICTQWDETVYHPYGFVVHENTQPFTKFDLILHPRLVIPGGKSDESIFLSFHSGQVLYADLLVPTPFSP